MSTFVYIYKMGIFFYLNIALEGLYNENDNNQNLHFVSPVKFSLKFVSLELFVPLENELHYNN